LPEGESGRTKGNKIKELGFWTSRRSHWSRENKEKELFFSCRILNPNRREIHQGEKIKSGKGAYECQGALN